MAIPRFIMNTLLFMNEIKSDTEIIFLFTVYLLNYLPIQAVAPNASLAEYYVFGFTLILFFFFSSFRRLARANPYFRIRSIKA